MEKHRYTLNPQIKHHKAVALHYLSLFRQKARLDPIHSLKEKFRGKLRSVELIAPAEFKDSYYLNHRFAWDIIHTKYPFHVREREEHIVDTKTGKILARYVDFDTDILGVNRGISSQGLFDYKIWLMKSSCESDGHEVNRGHFYNFEGVIEGLGENNEKH